MPSDSLIRLVAFLGRPASNSDLACRDAFPGVKTLPCPSFEETFAAVVEGRADRALIPIENSVAGRVADVHHLLPLSGLHIVGEHFERITYSLLAPKGATTETIRTVYSHIQGLQQCRRLIGELKLKGVAAPDTAGAAEGVAQRGDPSEAAIATSLAGDLYGLQTLRTAIEDSATNTTRFVAVSRVAELPDAAAGACVTSFVFRVRNVPAALYKALGGFATNGTNLTKLESYMVEGKFAATQFYAEAEGHPEERNLRLALEELKFFTRELKILGTYRAHPFRTTAMTLQAD